MVDKIFTDNDLLEEKSYDTKIMEGAGVEPDATYLEQTPVKKRLAEAINGGGSSEGGIVYVPVSVDVTQPENPIVTCETSVDTILGYFAEGKIVYLKQAFSGDSFAIFTPIYVEPDNKFIQWEVTQYGTPIYIMYIEVSNTDWTYGQYRLQLGGSD